MYFFLWSLKDRNEDFDRIDLLPPENISLPSSLNVLTPEQAVELLLLLSQNKSKDHQTAECIATRADNSGETADTNGFTMKIDEGESSSSSSSSESSGEFVDANSPRIEVQTMQTIEVKNISMENLPIAALTKSKDQVNPGSSVRESDQRQNEPELPIEYIDDEVKDDRMVSSSTPKAVDADRELVSDEICQQRFDELKQLLNDAHKAVSGIVSSQEENLNANEGKERNVSVPETQADDSSSTRAHDVAPAFQRSVTPSSLSCNLDGDNRAGKYHKKPAPKAPLVSQEDDVHETEPENALKATLVIKTGTLRTFSNADVTKDVFLARAPETLTKRKKKSGKLRAKESFSKLLTIPKNIFHSAFHKEPNESSSKEEDSSSTLSETSRSASRSDSVGSQVFADASAKWSTPPKQEVDVEEIPLRPERDNNIESPDKNIDSEGADPQTVTLNKVETVLDRIENDKVDEAAAKDTGELEERGAGNESNLEIHEMSRSIRDGRKEIITDIIWERFASELYSNEWNH